MSLLKKTKFTGNILSLLRLFIHAIMVGTEFVKKESFCFLLVQCITFFDFFSMVNVVFSHINSDLVKKRFPKISAPPRVLGVPFRASQSQISWTNVDQNHVYFVQVLYGKCTKRYLTKIVYDRHKAIFPPFKGLNDVL